MQPRVTDVVVGTGAGEGRARRRRGCEKGAAAIVAAVGSLLVAGAGAALGYDANASKFTLIAVPDPQYYAVVQWKTDQYYNTQMNWIVDNAGARNVGFVFGLGDEVQDGNPYTTVNHQITTTYTGNITPSGQTQTVAGAPSINSVDPVNHDFEAEWKRASNAWGILDNANIPNFPVAGNHDYYHWDQKKDPSEYVKYFGPSRYQNKSWYGGSSPVDPSQPSNLQYAGLNSYSYFYAGGYKFLNIALQYTPVQGDLNWAQGIINANPGLPTIISTHDYQNTSGRDGAGNNIWNNFVDKAGNDQIFMVLSGHVNGTHQQVSTDADGKQVFEILSDYQDYTFGTGQGYSKSYANGGGFLRTMDFDLSANTINVQTYSPYIDSQGDNPYLTTRSGTGANADAFTLNFDFAQRFGPPPFLTGLSFYWDPGHTNGQNGGGPGTWDASAGNWSNGTAANVPWDDTAANNTAIFGGPAAGTVTVAAGGVTANDITFKTAGYSLGGGTITLVSTSPTIDATAAAGDVTVNNVLVGSAGLTVNGGRVTLGGANTFTGGLTVSGGGIVAFAADNNLGAAGGGVTLDGGTVTYVGNVNGGLTQSRVYKVNTGGGTFDVSNPGPTTPGSYGKLVLSGNNKVTGSGPVTKSGPGWMTLYGSNNRTGDWMINGGVLEAGNPGAIGGGIVNVTVNGGGELAVNTGGGLANPITVNAGGTIGADVNVTNTTTLGGAITAAGAFNVRLGNFWSGTSQNVVLSGKVTGQGTLTVIPGFGATASTGKLTLAADNSGFSGGIVIPTGTVAAGLSGGEPLGTGAITLSGGRLALQGQLASTGPVGAIAPVAVTGFNRDTVYADTDTAKYPSGDSTNNTLMDGFFSYYQDGFTPGEGNLDQGVVLSGGIAGTAVTSAVNNTVTGAKTPFALQSFTATNALQVTPGSPASLTLATPAAFGNLSVLAVSSYGNNDRPSVTIRFADGTSVTTTYNAFDWYVNADPTKVAADAFAGGLNRYSPTQSPGWDQRAFGMYETDIDLTNIGGVDYSTRPVVGMTFSAAYTDSRAMTNIFAVSGSARGWVTGGNQTYANAVNVTADSSVDVTTSLNATMGGLTIGANKLSVTSGDTSGTPYSLAFGATAVNGNATFDVANSAGGGAGRLVLGSLSGNGVMTKAGAGTLRLAAGGVLAGGLSVTAGSVEVGANATLKSLAISESGKLDLLSNDMAIDYSGASPAAVARSYLLSGRDGGTWDGAGIVSPAAVADPWTAIGYREASQMLGLSGMQTAVWEGQTVDATSLLLMYTWYGDADLNGKVDADDYARIDRSFARHAGGSWVDGDFNYDGAVDAGDYLLIDSAYGRQNGGMLSPTFLATREAQFGEAYVRELMAAVPEPATAGFVGLAGVGMMLRRRRGR